MTVLAITKDGVPGMFLKVDEKTAPGDCMRFIKSAAEAVLACKTELEGSANEIGKTHDHRFSRSVGAVPIGGCLMSQELLDESGEKSGNEPVVCNCGGAPDGRIYLDACNEGQAKTFQNEPSLESR